MPEPAPKTPASLRLRDTAGQPLTGTVNVQVKSAVTGQTISVASADASKDVLVPGLATAPPGDYHVTVTPTDGSAATTQVVTVPPNPTTPITVQVTPAATPPVVTATSGVGGSLTLDHGLPAAGVTVRVYNIGFGGQATLLGQTAADAEGNYALSYQPPSAAAPNLQVRAVDAAGNEVPISTTTFAAAAGQTLNLVVPATVQPQASEFQRLSTDVTAKIGGVANLAQAKEGNGQQDLTLLSSATNWDARLLALAATAVQQTAALGLTADATRWLYALYRVGLPTDSQQLALVPAATVQAALQKASTAGVVALSDAQVATAMTQFNTFAATTRLAITTPGAVSNFKDLLAANLPDPGQQAAFANLFFANPGAGADLWTQAANLKIPAATLDTLKVQGKLLHLTINNAPLAAQLQKVLGPAGNIAQLADKDYHNSATWTAALTTIAGSGGDQALQALIPASYTGATAADRLAAYSADLARKVRVNFPTQVAARMIEAKELPFDAATAPAVTAFLRTATPLGYELGRTPLNAFIASSAKTLPAPPPAVVESVKTLHRMHQITPSTESLQAVMQLGFTSAHHITSMKKSAFVKKHGAAFPPGEAQLVYAKAQQVSSVTFNVFSMAKALETSPPIYGMSPSDASRDAAKKSVIDQFPSMATLFGSTDYCQCDDCRSVLSPAAYFVDLLQFLDGSGLDPDGAATQPAKPLTYTVGTTTRNVTPLDILVGNAAAKVAGRRPDLAALPLTCANTNTAMPYIDLVNEILEYYIANSHLDGGVAYDTGATSTAALTAEPQHVLTGVYGDGSNTPSLRAALYPLGLPFDLWIETVRGFLNYSGTPLAQLLETLRPVDELELFPGGPVRPYYRSQILAESLGLSPAEYGVLTVSDPATLLPSVAKWFQLYGYTTEAAALTGLASAETLAESLGLSYQELTNLVTTGFLNPALNAVMSQLERFGIGLSDAFSYTGQSGSVALTLQAKTDFETLLGGVTARYATLDPSFNARIWLLAAMPANYASKVLELRDPNTGCDFSGTTLQHGDGTPAAALDFLRLNLFVRLWKKLGWTLDETDRAMQLFFPATLPAWSDATFAAAFSAAWKTALVYLAHLDDLNSRLTPALGRTALLPLWGDLPTQGADPLYAQLFLTASVLNNNAAFDDPAGHFPAANSDPLAKYQAAVQGVLGLTADDLAAIVVDANTLDTVNVQGVAVPAFTLHNLSTCYRYSLLAKCLNLSVPDLIALKAMSGLNPFQAITGGPVALLADDVLYNQTLQFIKQAAAIASSGFTVTDLKYLLRHQFDPIGRYGINADAPIALIQSLANGLQQVQRQNAVAPDLIGLSESAVAQQLAGLIPAPILKTLSATLDALPTSTPQTAQAALTQSVSDILGVWATLAEYQATRTGVVAALPPALADQDAAVSLSYDQADQLQWLAYRGVLTDAKKAVLLAVNNSADLQALLADLQQQVAKPYRNLIGALLAMWVNAPSYLATVAGVAPADQINIDPAAMAPYPQAHFSYDPGTQIQSLGYDGVLSAATQALLTQLAPGSAAMPVLLQKVRDQATQSFQTFAAGLLTVAAGDLDSFSAPFVGVGAAGKQKEVKAQLVSTFAPLLADKLSRQLVAQVLTADLDSDASLTSTLFTDAGLLTDPSVSGKSLIGSFLAAGTPGVTASYYAAADGSGAALVTATADRVDLADLTNPNAGKAGTGSAHFEGYLQVATDGAYHFFAELGDKNAHVVFLIDAPDAAPGPIIDRQAATDGDEAGQFVQLKGGLAYHFTADFSGLGVQGASLLVQGENLPKGPLGQLLLYPEATVAAIARARVLLSKVLQIVQVIGLDERELSYLTTNAARFSNLKLGALPTQSSDDSVPKAAQLFSQFLTLADYADLRTGPAGASDGMVDVFEAVGQSFAEAIATSDASKNPGAPWLRLAQLTRRDPQVVRDVARYLSLVQEQIVGPNRQVTAVADFDNNRGVRRIWEALQLVQLVGIPVASLTAATAIVAPMAAAPDVIATSFKNAVKARFTPDNWNAIAQSIFDKLRQKKRDALVAYLVNALALDDTADLFEYFLVDPGMEPVVQTSRLRLALSSVQTFVQRCLLNLESGKSDATLDISPAAIDAEWWEWMKRYRVWQANREIFLFPENWMVPELRLDKTDLFQSLESALLQGDVTSDLVEDAFYGYLKGLDVRARLDIVAMYLEQDAESPQQSVLHVVGRTYGKPAKYFYRTYTNSSWSGWAAVTPDIEGDHIALAVWRGRVNLFWVTFITDQAAAAPAPYADDPTKGLGTLTFTDLVGKAATGKPTKQLRVQLHWSELVQGKWSNRVSTDGTKSQPFDYQMDDSAGIHVHVTIETDASGNEGAIRIHLDGPPAGQADYAGEVAEATQYGRDPGVLARPGDAFRIVGRNADPEFGRDLWETALPMPYFQEPVVDATMFTGAGPLQVTFQSEIAADGTSTSVSETILGSANSYALLTCSNQIVPPFLAKGDLLTAEAGDLVSPFFFEDTTSTPDDPGLYTFYVQPSLTEKTMSEAEGWAIPPSMPAAIWNDAAAVSRIPVAAMAATPASTPAGPVDPASSIYQVQSRPDWVTNAATTVSFGAAKVGSTGGVNVAARLSTLQNS